MNLLFTICARAGSKGIKNKNIRQFNGYPLLFHTLSAYSLFYKRYRDLYEKIDLSLNTDSEELVNQMKSVKIEYIYIKRSLGLGGDTVSKTDVIKETLIKSEDLKKYQYDIVIDLDLTSPLRTAADIQGVIASLLEKKADVSFSVTQSRRLPFFNMVTKKEEGYYNTIIPSSYVSRQQAPACYDMNASIYAYDRQFIMNDNTKRVFDGRAVIWEMRDTAVLDIDNEEDLELMEVIGRYIVARDEDYREIYNNINELCR